MLEAYRRKHTEATVNAMYESRDVTCITTEFQTTNSILIDVDSKKYNFDLKLLMETLFNSLHTPVSQMFAA